MAQTQAVIDGVTFPIAHDFENGRAIVNYGGVYVLVDRVDAERWELSGEPAREDEKPILNRLVGTIQTTTTVTKE